MSDYLHQKGYIYPLGRLTDEDAFYEKIEEEKNFNLNQDKFILESFGKNDYLIWLIYSTYGEKYDEFGSCRPCNQQEIYYHAPKFREILGEIDTKKLKFIDFCYYNSTECTIDYYLGEEEYKPMTLEQAIKHAKEVAASKCDECGKEHEQLAEWLQELQGYKDETPITTEFLNKNFSFVDSDDSDGIWAALYDNDPYSAKIQIDTDCHNEGFKVICEKGVYYAENVGQLKMFLTICGLGDFANQLK